MMLSSKWHERGQGCLSFPSFAIPKSNSRKRIEVITVNKATPPESNTKKANLSAARKERIKLPEFDDGSGGKRHHISEFLSHPCGIQTMLNTSALQSFQALDANTYRCSLPKVQLLNFEAAPVMDLRVTLTDEDCTVEMLACKFEGSKVMERQNDHFSAFMINHITWDTNDSESFLEADVKLNLALEIYTPPFTMLPISAVERPGNLIGIGVRVLQAAFLFLWNLYYSLWPELLHAHLHSNSGSVVTYRMMQALVDRFVPLLLQQLLQDYRKWVHQQLDQFP